MVKPKNYHFINIYHAKLLYPIASVSKAFRKLNPRDSLKAFRKLNPRDFSCPWTPRVRSASKDIL
jgi:hypothetical protein